MENYTDLSTGPPPVCDIFPARVNGLSQTQKNKTLLLRRKVRLLQEALVEQMQKKKVEEKQLPLESALTGSEVNWILDEPNMVRFLRAREWHVGKAFALLVEAIKFRRQLKAERIKPKEVKKFNEKGILYRKGFDREGHPLLYIRPASNVASANEGDSSIKLLVYMLERACQSMQRHEGVTAITFVVDYNKYTNQNQPPLHIALRFIDIFQNVYPERLAHGFLIDTPWYFSTFWRVISPFLPTRTAKKIKFIDTSKEEERKVLFDHVDAKYLESWVPGGGCAEEYNHEKYWQGEQKQFESFMRFMQDEFINKSQAQRLAEANAFKQAQQAGKDMEAAMLEAKEVGKADNIEKNSARDGAIAVEEGENDVQEEDESKETQELVEDEVKRKMLQEALLKKEDDLLAEEAEVGKKLEEERKAAGSA